MKPLNRVLIALLAPLAVLLLAGSPAAAHGGEGEAEVTSITRAGDDVTVAVHLKYVEDGHGVPDATVTVVVDDGTPITMEPGSEEGDYTATVPAAPGAAIRVTSVEPETSIDAVAPDADAGGTTTTAAESTTTEAPATISEDGEGEEAATTPTPVPDDTGSDDGSDDGISPIVIGAVVAVVLAAVVTAVVLLGRKTPADDEG